MAKTITRSFLGTTTDANKAFPGIEEIDMTVSQDPYGYYSKHDWQRTSHFNKNSIGSHLGCLNPRCQQGGLNLQNIVLFHPDGEHVFYCKGHEGTPGGRKIGDPCDNRFTVRLAVRRVAEQNSANRPSA